MFKLKITKRYNSKIIELEDKYLKQVKKFIRNKKPDRYYCHGYSCNSCDFEEKPNYCDDYFNNWDVNKIEILEETKIKEIVILNNLRLLDLLIKEQERTGHSMHSIVIKFKKEFEK